MEMTIENVGGELNSPETGPECDFESPHSCAELSVDLLRQAQARAQRYLNALSPRETDVLRLIVRGAPNKAVALQLQISEKTVEKHRGKVMKKLAARSMADLMRVWLQARPTELYSAR